MPKSRYLDGEIERVMALVSKTNRSVNAARDALAIEFARSVRLNVVKVSNHPCQ